jgi:hypothetical protein
MVAALSNPRAATIMARVTAALVEVVTTALASWDSGAQTGGGDNGGVAQASWDSGAQTGGRW